MKKQNKIVFKKSDFSILIHYLQSRRDIELGAMAFYSISEGDDYLNHLVNGIIIPRDEDYHSHSAYEMSLKPKFMEKCYQLCEKFNTHLLDIHTHPWATTASFSSIDDNEAIKKIDYMKQYVNNTKISFIVFGCSPQIVQARSWCGNNHTLNITDNIIVL